MTKKHIKNMLLALLVFISMTVNVSAASDEWNMVYSQSYDGADDAVVTEGISGKDYAFSAEVEDEALLMKSDSLVYYRVNDTGISDLNSANNSHGMSVKIYNTKWVCSELEEPEDGVKYSGTNTNAILMEEKGGLNSLGTVRIKRSNGKIDRNNIMFNVDTSLFTSTDNDYTVKIKYYTPDNTDKLSLYYSKKDDTAKPASVTVFDEGKAGTTDTWHTATVKITGADFTKLISSSQDYSMRLTAEGTGEIYVHSIVLYKTVDTGVDESATNTVFEQKISEDPIYGNAKLTYDLTFPTDIACAEVCAQGDDCVTEKYNTGENMMSVSLADSSKVEFASVLYDLDGTDAAIYAMSTDEGGDSEKILLYEGDIADMQLTYTVTLNMKEGTYTVGIENEGTPLALENEGPFTIYNKNEISLYCKTQYIRINHNQSSYALLSSVDNIIAEGQVDEDYEAAATDLDNITLEETVKNDFVLPSVGSVNGSEIQWTSYDSAITIDGNNAIVSRGEEDVTVTLLAEATYNGMTAEKEFEVTVKSFEGVYFEITECSGKIESDGTITAKAAVMHPGTTGAESITFAVFSVDSATGKICNTEHVTQDVTDTYGEMIFDSVTGMDAKGGNSVKCYLWDNNNKSLANNKPVVRDFAAESKVKGAGLSWKGYDDNSAIDYYEIYRNGSKIADVLPDGEEMKYTDSEVSGKNNTYSVIPIDTNLNKGEEAADDNKCGKISMPYYLNLIGESEAEINANGNGITMVVKASGAGYTEYNAEGRKIPASKYIPIKISEDMPKNNVAVEFTYKAAAGTKLQFLYNTEDGSSEVAGDYYTVKASDVNKGWLTFTVKLTDANLETVTGKMNNVHMALQALSGDIILKKIEMVELSKYE